MKLKLPPLLYSALISSLAISTGDCSSGVLLPINKKDLQIQNPVLNQTTASESPEIKPSPSPKESPSSEKLIKEVLSPDEFIQLSDLLKKQIAANPNFLIDQTQSPKEIIFSPDDNLDLAQPIPVQPSQLIQETEKRAQSTKLLFEDSIASGEANLIQDHKPMIYFEGDTIKTKSPEPIISKNSSEEKEPLIEIKGEEKESSPPMKINLEGGSIEFKTLPPEQEDSTLKEIIIKTQQAQLPVQQVTMPAGSIRIENQGRVYMDDIGLRSGTSLSIDSLSQLIVKDTISLDENTSISFNLKNYKSDQDPIIIAKALQIKDKVTITLTDAEGSQDYALIEAVILDEEGTEVQDLSEVFTLASTNIESNLRMGNDGIVYAIMANRSPVKGNIGSTATSTIIEQNKALLTLRDTARQQQSLSFGKNSQYDLWLTSTKRFTYQRSQSQSVGYHYDSWGYAAGTSFAMAENNLLHFAFNQNAGKFNFSKGAGIIDQDTYNFLLSSSNTWKTGDKLSFNLNLEAVYGLAKNKGTTYATHVDPKFAETYAKWDSQAWLVDCTGTWTYSLSEDTTLSLSTGIEYLTSNMDDHTTENKRDSYHLTEGSSYQLRVPVAIGIQHRCLLFTKNTLLYSQIEGIQTLAEETPRARVTTQDHSWMALGVKPAKTTCRFSTGAASQLTEQWSIGIGYQLDTSSEHIDQSAQIHLHFQF